MNEFKQKIIDIINQVFKENGSEYCKYQECDLCDSATDNPCRGYVEIIIHHIVRKLEEMPENYKEL